MKRNRRHEIELAEFLQCKPWQVMGYTPTPELLAHTCGECEHYKLGLCDFGNGDEVQTTFDTHSCRHFKLDTKWTGSR